ncbi:hypothetical protein GLOIN_2v1835524 [Rhizophagus irregularis DAOM 181602=DAOM 197198]|nr:hypothetical protein GLOIN_2v1835524 [Rhizophagus irregularis DAOM 181602=DAOM 197198]
MKLILCKNDITLSEVINYGIQFDRADILLNSFDINEDAFLIDIIYREEALNNGNIRIINNNYNFKKESKYISELKLMYKSNFWNSMIAFFGLASVLHRPIESLFPKYE